ncbi:hypothetical protein [Azospirillum doebereinerae]|uniref:Uncharacterized protein n=1 Tax=Azospirillum doebereinerae TaxID=92933 RepID=A0A3S0WI50_9PROT|nr:hypothetical protein [Azospirillum doebereinerae]RUQ61997.1 hypothetical protein EJ913_29395 [Azospirillum doebereinerae]
MSTAAPLMPILLAYQGLAPHADAEAVDDLRSKQESLLARGEIADGSDLYAKALYLRDTARIDPGLISMEAVDTLVAGVLRLHGPALSEPLAPFAVAA